MSEHLNHHTIKHAYSQCLDEGFISSDEAQAVVVDACQEMQVQLYDYYHNYYDGVISTLRSWISTAQPPKGLYIYGEVGRGKSMIMDLLYDSTDIPKKSRVHFHEFMEKIHEKMHAQKNADDENADPLPAIAADIAKDTLLLCFDEFLVQDIADAMIMGRLFTALFEQGVVVVATSNVKPDDLYKDGLQRQHFLPFIQTLKGCVDVHELTSPKDYRMEHLQSLQCLYMSPLGKEATDFIETSYTELTHGADKTSTVIDVHGRQLELPTTHGDIAMVSFDQLCSQALGAADYRAIAQHFSTVLISNIPSFNRDNPSEAKRFVHLIDQFYEHNVKLICTAAAQVDKLDQGSPSSFELKRTASRLVEMQSQQYLAKGHTIVA